jgi:hypothetical protein
MFYGRGTPDSPNWPSADSRQELPEGSSNYEKLANRRFHPEGVTFDKCSYSEDFTCCQTKIKICEEFRVGHVNPGPMSPGMGQDGFFLCWQIQNMNF